MADQYLDDETFFSRERIRVGTSLINVGQRERGGRWTVVMIKSHFAGRKPGQWVFREVDAIRTLHDRIVVENQDGMRRDVTFGVIKYSAIWRLA